MIENVDQNEIDPNNFTYDQYRDLAKKYDIRLVSVTEALNVDKDSPRKASQRNNGIIDPKFYYTLVGMIGIKVQTKLVSRTVRKK